MTKTKDDDANKFFVSTEKPLVVTKDGRDIVITHPNGKIERRHPTGKITYDHRDRPKRKKQSPIYLR